MLMFLCLARHNGHNITKMQDLHIFFLGTVCLYAQSENYIAFHDSVQEPILKRYTPTKFRAWYLTDCNICFKTKCTCIHGDGRTLRDRELQIAVQVVIVFV